MEKQTEMKVLVISVFPLNLAPEANPALHICEHLAISGASVHVLCSKGSISATHENISIHPVVDDWSWSDISKILNCLIKCRPDVVFLLYLPWMFNYKKMATILPTICKKVLRNVPFITQLKGIPYCSVSAQVGQLRGDG